MSTRRITTTSIPSWNVTTITQNVMETAPFKPKRAGTKTAHTIFLLDDSGSMQSCRKQTIDGFNEFLQGQKLSEVETFVSLYKFDGSTVRNVFDHVPVATVKPLDMDSYNPRGGTNLLDGIGEVMFAANGRLKARKKADRDSIQIVILTDGQENASRQFTNADIKSIVEKAEAKDWTFMFLGANIDAFSVGGAMGFAAHNTMQYSTDNMGSTMAAASNMSNRLKSARSMGADANVAYAASTFTDDERNNSK